MNDSESLIMVAGIVIAIIASFIGYKMIKKYFTDGECPQFCLTRQNNVESETDGQSTRNLFGSLLRRGPKLIINFSQITRVGDSVSFRILLPEPTSRSLFGTMTSSQLPPPSPSTSSLNHPTRHSQQLSNRIFIEIIKLIGEPEKITIIREFEHDTLTNEDLILATFSVREAGYYEIHVRHENIHLKNSPHLITFIPGYLDSEKTSLLRQSPTIVCKVDTLHCMNIEPKDRFGNLCRLEDIDVTNFNFKILHVDHSNKDSPMEAMTFNFTAVSTDDWGQTKCIIRIETEIFLPGIFQGILNYEDKLISNGAFDIVTLSVDEYHTFDNSKSLPNTLYHEAKLVALNSELQKKVKTVYIYVYPKQIAVKAFYLGFIPSRLAVFRILPATKIKLVYINQESSISTFTIQDRLQPKLTLEMNTSNHRIIMALFAHFLHERLGGSESFENKQKFFYEEVRNAREDKSRGFISVRINRNNLIDSSLVETKGFGAREWCRKFKVQFIGEEGMDDGGLRREWLEILCTKMFENNPSGMFSSIGSSRLVHPNPQRSNVLTLKHYELAGKVVGKCLFETSVGGFYKQMVNGRFSRSFLGQIIGFTPHFKHFELDDPELYLGKVQYILENDVSIMDLTFTEEEYLNGSLINTIDLIPNGSNIPVTNDNKEDYLNSLANYRLATKVQKEVAAFLKGLNEIIPDALLTHFDENELEILMCGKSTFDVEDLKHNHVVSETDEEIHKILRWFWTSVENMTDGERGKLLQFTTGSSLLPHGGFKELRPIFRITLTNTNGRLPIAHTCFNEICLSMHKSYEEFEKSLRTAVNECNEGFAFM